MLMRSFLGGIGLIGIGMFERLNFVHDEDEFVGAVERPNLLFSDPHNLCSIPHISGCV